MRVRVRVRLNLRQDGEGVLRALRVDHPAHVQLDGARVPQLEGVRARLDRVRLRDRASGVGLGLGVKV